MAISTQPAGLGAWRLATIGAVTALAVGVGIVAGNHLVNERASLGGATAYVPAGAPFYVELRVIPSAEQDAAVREFLGHFPPIDGVDLGRPLEDQIVEHLDDMLSAEGVELTWTDDVAPWFDGHLALAMTDLSMAGMEAMSAPPVIVFLGVTDATAAASAIDRILAAGNAPAFTETVHNGTTIHVADGEEGGAYALVSDQLIFGTDATAVVGALDAHADPAGTLATNADAARFSAALPPDWLAFVSYDLTGLMAEAFEAVPADAIAGVDAMRSLIEQQPLRGAMAVSAGGDRIALDAVSDAPSGAFAVENADRGLAAEAPGDAFYYAEASNIGAALTGVIEPLTAALAEFPEAAEHVAQIEAALGADITELVSWIGDGAMVAGMDAEPYAGFILIPTDRDAAERRLDQLAAFAAIAAQEPLSGLSVEESEIAGFSVTTLRWNEPSLADLVGATTPELVLQWTVTEDRAIVGVGDAFVGRVLGTSAGDSLAAQSRFTSAVAGLGGPVHAGMTWMDLAGLTSAMGDMLGSEPMGPLSPALAFGEVLAWIEPLDMVVSVTRLDGDLLVQRAALIVE